MKVWIVCARHRTIEQPNNRHQRPSGRVARLTQTWAGMMPWTDPTRSKDRYGLVTSHGIEIARGLFLDIRFRMLSS
jgi:hypothetical protein